MVIVSPTRDVVTDPDPTILNVSPESIVVIVDVSSATKNEHKFPFDEDGLTPYLVSQKYIKDKDDYNEFSCSRTFTEIDIDEPWEVISYGQFGQFFYNIYLGDKNERNIIKKKINNSLVYKQQYEDLVNSLIIPNTYNSVHIRYAKLVGGMLGEVDDFTGGTYPVGPLRVLERIEQLFEKDIPLYVAIDITQSSEEDGNSQNINVNDYLDVIRKKYNVIILEDFNLDLSYTEKIAVDQLFCVNSKTFYGAYNSTFSKRIDILRGIRGKTTYDYMGWNKIQPSYVRTDSPYPWKYTEKHTWPWYYSSYPQYMLEE